MASPGMPAWSDTLRQRWQVLALRERRLVALAAAVVGLALLWAVAIAPAWRSLRDAPQRLDALDIQWQQMQRLADDAKALRGTAPVPPAQAAAALRAATERLGDAGRLTLQGERAVLTVTGASGEQLRSWLAEVRSGARARPVEANLTRATQGYGGTLVVAFGALP